MRQHGRLDFHGGWWHLVTQNPETPARRWTNRGSALSDLAAEGWELDEHQDGQPDMKHEDGRHSYGYGLKRTLH